jgi:hypothetical protein
MIILREFNHNVIVEFLNYSGGSITCGKLRQHYRHYMRKVLRIFLSFIALRFLD